MTQAFTTGGRLHNNLGNRNLPGQHTSESAGVLSPSSINPNDIGKNWQDLGVITGDGIYSVSYLGSGIAIFTTNTGHVWRSSDHGKTWTDLGVITSPTFSRSSANIGDGIAVVGDDNGNIFRTTDFGITWAQVIATGNTIRSLVYIGSNGVVIAGDSAGNIIRSADYGVTWPLGIVVTVNPILVAKYLDNDIVLVGDNSGNIFRSTNITGGLPSFTNVVTIGIPLTIVYLGNGVVIIGCLDGHAWRSIDSGLNWTDLGKITPGVGPFTSVSSSSYVGNGVVVIGTGIGVVASTIMRSTDYGLTWSDLGIASGVGILASSYLNNGITIFGNLSGKIFHSDVSYKIDEARATVLDDLLDRRSELVGTLSPYSLNRNDIGGTVGATTGNWAITTAYGTAISCTENIGSGIVLAGTGTGHILRSTDHGKVFTDYVTLAAVPINIIRYLGNGIVIAGDNLGNTYRSIDYGVSFGAAVPTLTSGITAITYYGHGTINVFSSVKEYVPSSDYGVTYGAIKFFVSSYANTETYIDNGISVVGLNDGTIHRSTDFGATYPTLGVIGTGLNCSVYLGNGIIVMGDNNGHIYRSTNFGLNWTDLGDITGSNHIVITAAYLGNGVAIVGVVAGAAGRIFKSTDYGLTWINLTPGLFVSGTFFRSDTAKYLGNGVSLIADNAGNIFINSIGSIAHINEEFIQDIPKRIRTITVGETLDKDDDTLLVDATAGNIIIYLPSITSAPEHVFNFVRTDATANTVTIDAAGAETINLALTQPLNVQFMALSMKAKPFAPDAGWWII